MFVSSCIDNVMLAASESRLTIKSTASKKDDKGLHEGGLDLSSSPSTVAGTMRRDRTARGATLDRMTKQRSAGRQTGRNAQSDQAERASANASKQGQPESESEVLHTNEVCSSARE
jgi:hypothetical protein